MREDSDGDQETHHPTTHESRRQKKEVPRSPEVASDDEGARDDPQNESAKTTEHAETGKPSGSLLVSVGPARQEPRDGRNGQEE